MTPNGDAAVGPAYTVNNVYQSWIWRDGQFADMGLPEEARTIWASGIRADGDLAVGTAFIETQPHAGFNRPYVWTPESGWEMMVDWLSEQGISFPGWTFMTLEHLSPDGLTLAGQGRTPSGDIRGYVLTIPAPGAGAMLMAVGLGIGTRRYRGRRGGG
jgi:hypothetical protein